ncbi:MAG: hypothetical protein ABIY55_25890, partial [Kofleriaceae bacterium]
MDRWVAGRRDDDLALDHVDGEWQDLAWRHAGTRDARVAVGRGGAQALEGRDVIFDRAIVERIAERGIELRDPVDRDGVPVRPEMLEHIPHDDHIGRARDHVEVDRCGRRRPCLGSAGSGRIVAEGVRVARVERDRDACAEPASQVELDGLPGLWGI